jgi:hypothetical protein
MRKKIFAFAATIALLASAAVLADSPRSVDAATFDIGGVKLGMSKDEAVKAITTTLNLSKNEVVFDKYPSQNLITGKKEPTYFTVAHGIGKFTVYLGPNALTPNASSTIVDMIRYEMPWTPENVAAMKKAVIEKYGEPSNGTIGVTYEWCLKPSPNTGIGCGGFFNGPVLAYSGVSLKLTDPKYGEALSDFRNKKISAKPTF